MDSNGKPMRYNSFKMHFAHCCVTSPDDRGCFRAGLSDPFVHLCLEPYHIFPEVEPRCTQIKSCDLNPLFDEAFELWVVGLVRVSTLCSISGSTLTSESGQPSAFQIFLTSFISILGSLSPLYDSLVSLDQCQTQGTCLVVTVLDHDTLRTDDFEGEAFLALKAIPGVGGKEGDGVSTQPDAIPAQIRLPLMHPKPNGMVWQQV